jgi:hypothetical protein
MKKIIVLCYLMLFSGSVLSFGLPEIPKIPGAGSNTTSSAPSALDSQEAIVKDFKIAMKLMMESNIHIRAALGGKDSAKLDEIRAKLASGDCDNNCIKEAVKVSADASKLNAKLMENVEELNEDSKKTLTKAYGPLALGTLSLTKLMPKIKDWSKGAKQEIKDAGVMGAVKLKKKLDTGLFILKTTPSLIKEWGTASTSLVSFGKKIGLSKADIKKAQGEATFNNESLH